MTDAQFTALLTVLGTFGATLIGGLRWAVARITKALDDNTAVHRDSARAQVEHAKELSKLSAKIDGVADWAQKHTPVDTPVIEEIEPHRRRPDPTPMRGVTLLPMKEK